MMIVAKSWIRSGRASLIFGAAVALVGAIGITSVLIAAPTTKPDQKDIDRRGGGYITGNGYPSPRVAPPAKDSRGSAAESAATPFSDLGELKKAVDVIAAQRVVLGTVLRGLLAKVFRPGPGDGDGGEITVINRGNISPGIDAEGRSSSQGCYMRGQYEFKFEFAGDYRLYGLGRSSLVLEFAPAFYRLPLYAKDPHLHSRIRTLLHALVFSEFVSGFSGTEQDLTMALVKIAMGKRLLPADEAVLARFERSFVGIGYNVPKWDKWTGEGMPPETIFDKYAAVEWKHRVSEQGATILCHSWSWGYFTKPKLSPALHAQAARLKDVVNLSPSALTKLQAFLRDVASGDVPVYVSPLVSRTKIAKLVLNHAGAEIVLFNQFMRLPLFDDAPDRPSQLKVIIHEGLHFIRSGVDAEEESDDTTISEQEQDILFASEILYRLIRGLPVDFLGVEPPELLSRGDKDVTNDDWLGFICRQIAKDGLGFPAGVAQILPAAETLEILERREIIYDYYEGRCSRGASSPVED